MHGDKAGRMFVDVPLSTVAAATATVIAGLVRNPFLDLKAKLKAFKVITPVAVVGDDTNTKHINIKLVDGTEIGNLDLATALSLAVGVAQNGTLSGTAAQLLLAANSGTLLIEVEKIGTGVALPDGLTIRFEFEGGGV